MVKTIYFVRHGQTEFNLHHKVQGICDSPLTQLGIRQVEAVKQYFIKNNIYFDLAFSSPQKRACDTLKIITSQKYICLEELKEKDYGILEGEPEFLLPWKYSNKYSYPTMEPNKRVLGRMERAVEIILNRMEDGQVSLVVGHGNTMGRYIHHDIPNIRFPFLENGSIVKVDYIDSVPIFKVHIWPSKYLK